MNNLEEIILYGAGNRCQVLVELMDLCNMPIKHIVDSNNRIWGTWIGQHVVESPDVLLQNSDVSVCITAARFLVQREIRKSLKQNYGLDMSHEVSYHSLIMDIYEKDDILRHLTIKNANVSSKISVIFDCEFGLVLGGVEEWTKGVCREFIRQKEYKPYILANYADYEVPEDLQNYILREDVKIENIFSIDHIKKLMACISKHLPCILITSQPDDVLLSGKILKKFWGNQVSIVSGIRGSSEEIYQNYLDMQSCTDLYVCVSSDIRRDMLAGGIDKDKIFTMICPIPCPGRLERKYTENQDKPIRLGYAGRIVIEQKRMDLILQMISRLEDLQVNFDFELAGEGDDIGTFQQTIKENNWQDKVKLIGKIDGSQIPLFWQDKDICINLADYEGRSRSIVEAMANGAIPVVTATSGVDDDIVNGKNGFIVNIGDYIAMADQIAMLDKNRVILSEMGTLAHLEVKQKSSMENHYYFWQQILEMVRKNGE